METPAFPLGGLQMSGSVQSKLCCWLEPPPSWFPNGSAILDTILPIKLLFYVLFIFITDDNRETSVLSCSGLFISSHGVAIMIGTHSTELGSFT